MPVTNRHQPMHQYLDNQNYFLTAHIYSNSRFLTTNSLKQMHLEKIKKYFSVCNFKLYAWVILVNHYHILFKTRKGRDLARCMGQIHGGFSYETNKSEDLRGRKIWQNYWDRCIRCEKDFWTHMNYIHHNPVKQRLARSMEEYEFSSCGY